jgi:aminopeptidase N
MENKIDSFTFSYNTKPDLINVDGDKILLCTKKDNKTAENYVHQIKHASLYLDRREALDYFAKNNMGELARGLSDKYAPLRRYTIGKIGAGKMKDVPSLVSTIEKLANEETDKKTKAAAIAFLAKTKDAKYLSIYEKNVNDSSYTVSGEALNGLTALEPEKAYTLAKKYSADAKGRLGEVVSTIVMSEGTEADFDFIYNRYNEMPLSQEKVSGTDAFTAYLLKVGNIASIKKGIDAMISFRNQIPEQFRSFIDPGIKGGLDKIAKAKGAEIEEYIKKGWK